MNLTENQVQVQNKTNTSQFRVKRLLTVKLGSHLGSVSLAGNSDKFNGLVNLLVKCLKMLLSGFVPVQVWLLVRCSYRLSLVERCWHGGAAVRTFASQQQGCRFEARGLFLCAACLFSPRVSRCSRYCFSLRPCSDLAACPGSDPTFTLRQLRQAAAAAVTLRAGEALIRIWMDACVTGRSWYHWDLDAGEAHN